MNRVWLPDNELDADTMRRCLYEVLARSDRSSFFPCDTARLPPAQQRRQDAQDQGCEQVRANVRDMLVEIHLAYPEAEKQEATEEEEDGQVK